LSHLTTGRLLVHPRSSVVSTETWSSPNVL